MATTAKQGGRKRRPTKAAEEAQRKESPASDETRGRRLNPAAQMVRDSRMIQRRAQGWTWPMVAEEAGISVAQAKRMVEARRAALPLDLSMDPVQIIEQTFEGFQLSIGDQEALAAEAASSGNLAVAVGAKKAANEAREKILTLLQMTGRMPQELGALRHLIDLRAIAVRMLDAVDGFERAIKAGGDPVEAALQVRSTFHEIIGIEDAGPPPEDAEEVPALPEPTE